MPGLLKKLDLAVPIRSNRRKPEAKKNNKLGLIMISLVLMVTGLWLTKNLGSNAFHFVFSQNNLQSTNDRVNVLLLGMAGGMHQGAFLTDSIIVASYHLKTGKVVLISIPRDLWLNNIRGKINSAYEIGLTSKEYNKNGLKFAEDKIDDILGIPIHYGIRLDFDGFAKAVDLIGGVDVEVPNTLDDYQYPITGKENDLCGYQETEVDLAPDQAKEQNLPSGKNKLLVNNRGKIASGAAVFNCRFEHLHISKGLNHLNGPTALKYVRSRHGLNGEGSDFARSKRQQLVIQAFRNKVLSAQTLLNPQKVGGLLSTLGKSIETDISPENYVDFYDLLKKQKDVTSLVLGDLDEGKSLFINPPPSNYGRAWVLTPPNDDFKIIQDYLKTVLDKQAITITGQQPSSSAVLKGKK